jgi:hypothetical protein
MYPNAWRRRYGSELEALIEDSNTGWRDALDILTEAIAMQFVRWPVIVAVCAALGALTGVAASFLLPQLYVSSASVTVITPGGVTPPEALATTLRTAMSRQALTDVIRTEGLYATDLLNKPVEEVVHTMRRNISVRLLPPAQTFENSRAVVQ